MAIRKKRIKTSECKVRKKAIYFTIDALIANALILIGLLLIPGIYFNKQPMTQLSYISQDFVGLMAELKVSELNSTYVNKLIADKNITHINNTILEQIGEFWAEGNTDLAKNFTQEVMQGNVPPEFGYGVWVGGEEIYSKSSPNNLTLVSSRKLISGYAKSLPVYGYTSKVYLTGIKQRAASSIVYFGGYVGEGNITTKIFLPQNITNVTDMYLELVAGTDAKLYINGFYAGSFPQGAGNGSFIDPDIWEVDSANLSKFHSGENNFTIKFEAINENFSADGPQYIGGGYAKVSYITTDTSDLTTTYLTNNSAKKTYYFSGIDGFINTYSSIYVPGNLTSINVYLDYYSNYTTYLNIGNTTVYEDKKNGSIIVNLTNTNLSFRFQNNSVSYASLSSVAIPIRISLKNATRTSAPFDAVLVTDVSGSMDWRMDSDSTGTERTCTNPALNNLSTQRLSVAKCAANDFISTILNNIGPLVGLVSYEVATNSTTQPTDNATKLYSQINNYDPLGNTCICCGVNSAVQLLTNDSQVMFISRKSAGWKYNDTNLGSDPINWTNFTFKDTGWKNGQAALGNGYTGLNTVISKYVGYYYFRKKFNVTNATDIKVARIYVYSDSGADVYLNGRRIDNDIGSTHTAAYWNRYVDVNVSHLIEGENLIVVKLRNRQSCSWFTCWTRNPAFDLEFYGSKNSILSQSKKKAMVVMTDGEANQECIEQANTGDLDHDGSSDTAKDDAIKAACDAYKNYGISVYTVGFGISADDVVLRYMANCTDGQYFNSTNYNQLRDTYLIIANSLIQFTETQTVNSSGVTLTKLNPNSFIEVYYTPDTLAQKYGDIPVTGETTRFGNSVSNGFIYLPNNSTIVDVFATSYSADKWTDFTSIQNSGGTNVVFNLSKFGSNYHNLGDVFSVHIPSTKIKSGENNLIVTSTGTSPQNKSGGSPYNRIIYTIRLNGLTDYGTIYSKKEGCNWTINFYDGTNATIKIPAGYNGTKNCSYANASFDSSDAMNNAAYNLFKQLDFEKNGNLEVKLDENNLAVDTITISDVPSLWGPAVVEVRLW